MMNKVDGERERWRREMNGLFWIERLFLFLVFVFPTYVFNLIVPLITSTTLMALPIFLFLNPNLSSVGPSGIGGFWLFLLDRSTFYLGLENSKLLAGGFEFTFLWRLTLSLSVVIHSIYVADHFLRSHQAVLPPPQSQNVETPIFAGDVHKDVEKVKELVEDGKKMMTSIEHMIYSGLETIRKEWVEFRDDGKKEMNIQVDVVEHMICSELETLKDNMRHNVEGFLDDLRSKVSEDIRALRQDPNEYVKSVADQLHKTYLAIQENTKEAKTTADKSQETYLATQETYKEAKTTADKALETYLAIQESYKEAKTTADKALETYLIFQEGQNKRPMIRGEDVEGFVELREQVRRMSVEAEIAAEEQSRATGELVDARIQQWEEDNADYLASLPLLYCTQHN